jgi:hypothetical protein
LADADTPYYLRRWPQGFGGPYEREEVDDFISRGVLRFDDYVWTPEWPEWRTAGEVYPDYAPQPPEEVLTTQIKELLDNANAAAHHTEDALRNNPVELAKRHGVSRAVAAWACVEAENKWREALQLAIRLLKTEQFPTVRKFHFRFSTVAAEHPFIAGVITTIVADALHYKVIEPPENKFDAGAAVTLTPSAADSSVDALIARYAADPRSDFDRTRRPDVSVLRYTGERHCTSRDGQLLYVVKPNGRVHDRNGIELGRVLPNGDVFNSNNVLLARRGDPGLLLAHGKNEYA